MFRCARGKERAFTLIELLAAIAVLAILTLLLTTILTQVQDAWIKGENRVETFQGARLALDMISRDLENATVATNNLAPPNSRAWPFVAIESTTDADISAYGGTAASKAVNTSSGVSSNDQVFFVAPPLGSSVRLVSTTSSTNMWHEYGYFTMFASSKTLAMKGGRYYLMRMETFGDHRYLSDTLPSFDVYTNNFTMFNASWYITPNTDFGNTQKPPLLENVLRFELDYIDQNGVRRNDWPTNTFLFRLPRAALITVTILDRRTAERLAAIRPGGLAGDDLAAVPDNISAISDTALRQTLLEGARTFSRTVNLSNAR